MIAAEKSKGIEIRQNPAFAVMLMGALLLLLAVGAAAYVVSTFVSASQTYQGQPTGTLILGYLNDTGLILPLVAVALGVWFFRLGFGVLWREYSAAGWARMVFTWLLVAVVILIIRDVGLILTGDARPADVIATSFPLLLLGGALGYSLWWLAQYIETAFNGQESLLSASTRTAWNLLIPTVFVLLIVAARPLEETFISSLTDAQFARNQTVNFVGIDNYARLLGFRFDRISCERGEDGTCVREEDGAVVFPRPREVLGERYTELRYRDVFTITLGSSQLLFSARDRDFMEAISNTLLFSVISVTLETLLGLGIAMVINSKFPGRGLMRAAILVPWAIPTVVSARLWEMMLRDNQSGIINYLFVSTGIFQGSQAWLANTDLQLISIIAVDVWKTTPFMALIILAGLQVIPSDIYEAADVDGASKVRQFFSLTLPLLRPTLAVALVFRTLDAIRVFDVFQVLLGRQKLSMATYNYETLIQNQDLGYASAIGVVIFIIILIFTVTYVRILGVSAE
ncbi:MAG: sugar ABC transporter permease [bacterium]|nr:sugar ABC transporter permease [bacterium]